MPLDRRLWGPRRTPARAPAPAPACAPRALVMNGSEPAMTADAARPHGSPTTAAPQGDVDTVEHAASTPDQAPPYADLGVKDDEYQSIREMLGRRPTNAELARCPVMCSEHCSYKYYKKHLR